MGSLLQPSVHCASVPAGLKSGTHNVQQRLYYLSMMDWFWLKERREGGGVKELFKIKEEEKRHGSLLPSYSVWAIQSEEAPVQFLVKSLLKIQKWGVKEKREGLEHYSGSLLSSGAHTLCEAAGRYNWLPIVLALPPRLSHFCSILNTDCCCTTLKGPGNDKTASPCWLLGEDHK